MQNQGLKGQEARMMVVVMDPEPRIEERKVARIQKFWVVGRGDQERANH